MTVILDINTSESLFDPIEIKIDGEIFRVNEMTQGTLERLQELYDDIVRGSSKAVREALELVLDHQSPVVAKVKLSQLRTLVESAITASIKPTTEQKNAQTPGGAGSPS